MRGMGTVALMAIFLVMILVVGIVSGIMEFIHTFFTAYLLYLSIAIMVGGYVLGKYRKNNPESKMGFYAAGVLFAAVVGGYFYNSFLADSTPAKTSSNIVQTSQKAQNIDYHMNAKMKEQIENDLNQVGMHSLNILASSIGHNKDGYLAIAENKGDRFIVAMDKKDHYAAIVLPYTPIADIQENPVSVMKAMIMFPYKESDPDDGLGMRENHIQSVLVSCEYSDSKNGLVLSSPIHALSRDEMINIPQKSDLSAVLENTDTRVNDAKKEEIIKLYVNDVRILALAMKANQIEESSLMSFSSLVDAANEKMEKAERVENGQNSSSPESAFRNYHKLITKRDYLAAYNCLTPSFQSAMGDWQSWGQGYATTVSSVPDNIRVQSNDGNRAVLSFRLKAVDQIGTTRKTQYFTGTCTLLKINGQWLIDEITAQQA